MVAHHSQFGSSKRRNVPCSVQQTESRRVESSLRSATSVSGPSPIVTITKKGDGKHNRHWARPCVVAIRTAFPSRLSRRRHHGSCAALEQLCTAHVQPPSVRLLRVFLPSRPLSWELSHKEICRNNETEPV